MQAYGRDFAYIYNLKWSGFINQVAPRILDFYASTPIGQANKSVLDLCCGAGHLAVHFLEKGYKVVGIDLSEHMLHYARENAGRFLESGQGRFVNADASDFTLNERFGLVVSTYDSLNHLDNEQALTSCFRCVHAVSDGYFIFDLNTRKGLRRWNNIQVDESSDDTLIITRGIYDGQSDKAWTRITGFFVMPEGLYKRFDETVSNTVFDMERVRKALLEVGWKNIYFARIQDLSTSLAEPEEEGRIFIVAGK
nr:class I SAM-dependent methyltransferase [candidate division Zixibacteria bacterium]